ncbi:hypothetical protein CLOSTHATH_06376 [Hungatella hathewayi DSM 13479]|uniref:Uncharacterized protein n=1 Tax=Hungatella hathewayi DSM 13479 TaxID=566550 RepID=D3ARX0_9FIRM|nr:hypothetical protein CLOSTHATH_06376 [Hungatella hathewayi DSM 13479]
MRLRKITWSAESILFLPYLFGVRHFYFNKTGENSPASAGGGMRRQEQA